VTRAREQLHELLRRSVGNEEAFESGRNGGHSRPLCRGAAKLLACSSLFGGELHRVLLDHEPEVVRGG